MKSIIFFVATITAVLAAPYYPALQVYSNGAVAPVETPEVQHEKAKHFAAHAERAHGVAPVAVYAAPHAYGYHVPVIHNGVPVDTPEVQHARAAHFAALAKAGGAAHYDTYSYGDDGSYKPDQNGY
uniref:CSON012402 protein n=1 Tax=Culicoides sonorensis TaxID=179676 RepID=A0A336KKX0_CULSO